MHCDDVKNELLAYIEGELSPEERETVETHLIGCPDCRRELDAVERFMGGLRDGMATLEPAGDFRRRLMSITDDGVPARPDRKPQSSRRFHGEPKRGSLFERARESLRRSPYFAISLLAHAAVIAVVAFAAIHYHDGDTEETHIKPHFEVVDTTFRRKNAARTERPLADGTLDLEGLCTADAVFLHPGDEPGCLWGFPAGGDGNPSEKQLLSNFSDSDARRLRRVETLDGLLRIPTDLVSTVLGSATKVVAMVLTEKDVRRLEIWSADGWTEYMRRELAMLRPSSAPDILRVAALPSAIRREDPPA